MSSYTHTNIFFSKKFSNLIEIRVSRKFRERKNSNTVFKFFRSKQSDFFFSFLKSLPYFFPACYIAIIPECPVDPGRRVKKFRRGIYGKQ